MEHLAQLIGHHLLTLETMCGFQEIYSGNGVVVFVHDQCRVFIPLSQRFYLFHLLDQKL